MVTVNLRLRRADRKVTVEEQGDAGRGPSGDLCHRREGAASARACAQIQRALRACIGEGVAVDHNDEGGVTGIVVDARQPRAGWHLAWQRDAGRPLRVAAVTRTANWAAKHPGFAPLHR